MRDELLGYYEDELLVLRQLGAEFRERYPKIASRLHLERDRCEDPHVERLIEAFALLTARVRLKLDDELPEVTHALLANLLPSALAPVPSMSVVQFGLDPEQAALRSGQTVARGSILSTRPLEGTACRFWTSYPVTLWPVELQSVRFEAPTPEAQARGGRAALRLRLRSTAGLPLGALRQKLSETEELPLSTLRFYLHGEQLAPMLYELLLNDAVCVELAAGAPKAGVPRPLMLGADALRPVGFEPEEGLLPGDPRVFVGYRLLQELFALPEKFLFVDLCGLERVGPEWGESVDVVIGLRRGLPKEQAVNEKTLRLHCTPIVNLFRQVAEPIRLTHLTPEYRVVPDVHRQDVTEVYSVDRVTTATAQGRNLTFAPFYSFKNAVDRAAPTVFWYANRRPSTRKDDEGSDVFLSFVNLDVTRADAGGETVTVETTCTNRDLTTTLRSDMELQLEGAGVFSSIRALKKPTPCRRPALGRGAHWKLLSHLSLNSLSLADPGAGDAGHALRELLTLLDVSGSDEARRQIEGIAGVRGRRIVRPLDGPPTTFVRGIEVTLELDEAHFVGSGAFLFASVLERFLAHYSSLNSFSQTVLTTRQAEGVVRRFPPRSGRRVVL